ncbi:nucleotidyltransferase family protein [Micromonospora sp. NPDC006766]|uniref:nucleotidyltransferase family protein n=1 Tax=Micromonospora sp. NPDC006766 TaxID=3154778 RepID=UPI00340D1257
MTDATTDLDVGMALRCLALDAAAATAVDTLRRADVDSVLLKGAGLARRLGTERLYADVDLLVAPAAFGRAQAALAAAGFRPHVCDELTGEGDAWHQRSWYAPGPLSLTVDLHRGFAGVDDPEELWRALRAGAEPMALGGGTVPVPDTAGCALLAALHAASPGRFVKPAADLALALDVLPAGAWPAAARIAVRCAATPAFAVGLRLLPAGAAVATQLALPTSGPPLPWLTAHGATPTAITLARLAELPGWRRRLRHLARLLLPSATYLRYVDPRARTGPGGLLLAHARRYGRHTRTLLRALRELHTARRLNRG